MPLHLIKYRCPHCGKRVAVDEEEIGTEIRCPNSNCRQPILVEPRDLEDDWSSEKTLKVVHPAAIRAHPLIVLGLLSAMVVGALVLWQSMTGGPAAFAGKVGLVVGGILIAGSAFGLLGWWRYTRCTTLRLTNERSLFQQGILHRQLSDVRHRDVRNMQVRQTPYQRMAGVGDLSLSSAGQEDHEIVIRGICDPKGIAGMIRSQAVGSSGARGNA